MTNKLEWYFFNKEEINKQNITFDIISYHFQTDVK